MKKIPLLGLFVCTLFGYAQTQVRQDTTADSSFKAFLPEWEKAQSTQPLSRFADRTSIASKTQSSV